MIFRYILFMTSVLIAFASGAWAWGRHDLITRLALSSPELAYLAAISVEAESIEKAAPDLLANVIPALNRWSARYFREHDQRFAWTEPGANRDAESTREALLWALENNRHAPLDFNITASDDERAKRQPTFGAKGLPSRGSARDIIGTFVDEPDAQLDNKLDSPAYLARLREQMGLFFEDGSTHTHTFRHYYVPSSVIPPLLTPRGMAPYRAALYAELARLTFQRGHHYWGYRFLSWALHYAQDVTLPWHTVLVPSFKFLHLSRATMRHEIAACHYFTEALADSWLIRSFSLRTDARLPAAIPSDWNNRASSPWLVAQWCEDSAVTANSHATSLANATRELFMPFVRNLDTNLRPIHPAYRHGDVNFLFAKLDFTGNGAGATEFLAPLWDLRFSHAGARDNVIRELSRALSDAVELSRRVAAYVLSSIAPRRDARHKF